VAVRAYDVLTTHSPLVGQFSSSSTPGHPHYGPGPLVQWLLALPAHIGPSTIAVTVGMLNLVTVVAIVAVARRRRGTAFMFAVAAALVLTCGSLPTETFHDPLNPYIPLLPFTLLIFLCWSLACGDYRLLPVTVVIASFAIQSHLAFVPPTIALLAVGLGGLAVSRSLPRRWLVGSAAAGLVCWSAPILDQAIHRPGNLVALVRAAGDQGRTVGLTTGWHVVVRTLGIPPTWLGSQLGIGGRLHDFLVAPGAFQVLSCVLLLTALALVVAVAVRRRDAELASAAAIGLALCPAMVLVAAATPTRDLLVSTLGYSLDWGSAVGMWVYLVLGWELVALLRLARRPALPARLLPAVGLGAVAVLGSVVTLAGRNDDDAPLYRPIRAVVGRLHTELGRAHIVRVDSSPTFLGFDFQAAVVYALRRDGRHPLAPISPELGGYYERGPAPERYVYVRDASSSPPRPGRVVARVTVRTPPTRRGAPEVQRRVVVTVAP
jgi:hypothetical protein